MATKKISELTLLDTVSANLQLTVIPVLDTATNTTRRVTLQQINDSVEANIPFAAAAFTQANSANTLATSADQRAITSGVYANSAFGASNSASSYSNSAFSVANTTSASSITSGLYANSAYIQANTATSNAANADQRAVTSGNYANSAYIQANSASSNIVTTGLYANSAYAAANISDQKATTSGDYANSAFSKSNSSNTLAQAAYDTSNTSDQKAVTSGSYANSAYTQANTATTNAANADQRAVTSGDYANSAYSQANTANTLAQAAYDAANSSGGGLTANNILINDSGFKLDGGSGTYWTGQSGVVQVTDKSGGIYHTTSVANNALFTFGVNGSGSMSVGVEGSVFIGTAKPSNDGGVTTDFPGWLVVQNGAKFGAGIDTLGATIIGGGVFEKYQSKADATGVVEHDCSAGHIFYHTSPDANWTANFTNASLSSNYATTFTLVISQGGTGYYPNAVQIQGSSQTINWQGNVTPTPSTNRVDVVTFSVLYNGSSYVVLGQMTGF
jgi:hypothetical protein